MKKRFLAALLIFALMFSFAAFGVSANTPEVAIYSIAFGGPMFTEDIIVRVGGREYTVPTGLWAGELVERIVGIINDDPNSTVIAERTPQHGNRAMRFEAKAAGTAINFHIVIPATQDPTSELIIRSWDEFGMSVGEELGEHPEKITDLRDGGAPPPPPPTPTPTATTTAAGETPATPEETTAPDAGEPEPNGENDEPETTTVPETTPETTEPEPNGEPTTNGDDEPTTPAAATNGEDGGAGWIIWLIIGIVVVGGGAAAIVIVKKKKA